jgi:hypothetical protein
VRRGSRNREAVPKRDRCSGLQTRHLDHPGRPRKVRCQRGTKISQRLISGPLALVTRYSAIDLHEVDPARHRTMRKRLLNPAQRARRAASRNSNSLRVSEIVSLRFTPSGLRPSARSRSRRTRSPSTSGDRSLGCSTIELTLPSPLPRNQQRRASRCGANQLTLTGTGMAGKFSKSPWPLIRKLHHEQFVPRNP